ncbi:MAG: hypothetical protein MO852_01125 [Candidatus Devosia euplotis]|nr:hypothetical protein [Candidatus Devosia euplotis]
MRALTIVENARSLNLVVGIVLAVGLLYILGLLYISVVTATQSFDDMLRNGLSLVLGGQFFNSAWFIFTRTRIPVQILNSLIVAVGDAPGTCVFSFLAACVIVYFCTRWAGIAFALILVTIMLPLDIRVITAYQVTSNVLSPINALLDITGITAYSSSCWAVPSCSSGISSKPTGGWCSRFSPMAPVRFCSVSFSAPCRRTWSKPRA